MSYSFDEQSVKRLARQTRESERRLRGIRPPIRYYPTAAGSDLELAQVSSTITARQDLTLGKGKVKLFDVEEDTLTLQDEEQDVFNFWGVSIDQDSHVLVGSFASGLVVVARECLAVDTLEGLMQYDAF